MTNSPPQLLYDSHQYERDCGSEAQNYHTDANTTKTKSKKQLNRFKRKEAKAKSILQKHEDKNVKLSDTPTKMLYVSNAGLGNGVSREHVYVWLSEFGKLQDIIMLDRKPYCFIVTADLEGANRISLESGNLIQHAGLEHPVEHFIFFVQEVPEVFLPNYNLPEGLLLLHQYVSEDCEKALLDLVDWTNGLASNSSSEMKNRQVRHYGYEFKYTTNNVDPEEPLDDSIPELCKQLCDRLIADGHMIEQPDQLTVNRYEPGQGIPPHVDTHSAFTDVIVSVSLGSQVVMSFSNNDDTRQVLLPRRSVLIMSGASRYGWSHGIVPRKIDVIQDADRGLTLSYRQVRTSFTFRRLRRAACQCGYPKSCDSQNFGKQQQCSESALEKLTDNAARKLESLHVHQVYDNIATHFSGTRHKQWPRVVQFLNSLSTYSIVVDIGCGNGKYLTNDGSHHLYKVCWIRKKSGVGCHLSIKNYPIVQADCLATPLRDSVADASICIAVIHHLATESRRQAAIEELIRVVRPGGKCLIYVWAMEQSRPPTQHRDDTSSQVPAQGIASTYLKSGASDQCSDGKYMSTLDGHCQLPVHQNRTQFASKDMLVPWNLKKRSPKETPAVVGCDSCAIANSKVPLANNTPGNTLLANEANEKSDDNVVANEKARNLYHRYYHIFEEGELDRVCSRIPNCEVTESYYDEGNWCVILTKLL
ncbi:ALKBH8 [Bugula neritina]|uniref:ALKBH8 n=1 Tax=Bugula neritina TaxID=10212 RepID=A0A7J7J6L1_BUGNE|nr:ALKBH8 [Bugula neritina]